MDEEEKKWLCDWIGCKFLTLKKHPRPKMNKEWRAKWERWNIDQHKLFEALLSGDTHGK